MNICEYSTHSNIALVKYWGKRDNQIPCNPSISFTLKKCQTLMKASAIKTESFNLKLVFEGVRNKKFEENISSRLKRLPIELSNLSITIESENTFPHSSGIASSASSMSCLAKVVNDLYSLKLSKDELSNYARLLSGSACRSISLGFQSWGKAEYLTNSSDQYSTEVKVHSDFHDLKDCIIIVDSGAKKVSSTQGHESMKEHPYRKARYEQARKNHEDLVIALKAGDWKTFNHITKIEALSLHSLMMSSPEPYFLIRPNSLKMIELIEQDLNKDHFTYTLDAGANIHLIYRSRYHREAKIFLDKYSQFFESYLEDEIVL